MANKTITMLQIKRIIQLLKQGKSNREIARELNISRITANIYVKRIQQQELGTDLLLKLGEEELLSRLQSANLPVPANWRFEDLVNRLPSLIDELKKPHATRMIIWEEYRQQVADGYSYSQFCEHLSRALMTQKAVMHFDHKPAACMMFDFAGDKVRLVDMNTGEITYHPVLVCVLPFSAFTYIEVLPSAKREQLLKALNNALSYIGGVPYSLKTDNMGQIVKKSNRYEPGFDALAEQWSAHYGCTLTASRVRKPRDKASVESHVNAIYNRVYAPLRNTVFHSINQVNEAFWNQLNMFNIRKMQRCDYSRNERFTLHEKPLLLPLPTEAFAPKNRTSAKVQRNYHVTLGEDWHHYSVPYQHIGKQVQLIYDTDNVEIYLGSSRIACHRRNYQKNSHTTVSEHMPSAHKHFFGMKGWTGDYFIGKATLIGPCTVEAISKILQQRIFIEQTYNSSLGVLRLGEKYGNERLEAACRRSLKAYKVTYTIIKNILERNLDKVPEQTDLFSAIPDHDNIRGPESYQ
jgi:transposase